MSFTLSTYRSKTEMERAQPTIKSFTNVLQIPRGTTSEGVLALLRKRGATGQLFQVGDFVWKAAETTAKLCRCLSHIGDNGPCPVHGEPLNTRSR